MTKRRRTKKNDNPLDAITIEEWLDLRENGAEIQLPYSRLVVKVRPLSLREAIVDGIIPDELSPVVHKLDADGFLTEPKSQTSDLREFMRVVNPLVVAACIEPAFSAEDPAPNVEHVSALPVDDRLYLYRLLDGGVAALKSFRAQPVSDVGTLAGQPESDGESAE